MRAVIVATLILLGAASATRADAPLLLQKPTLSKTHIAFTFAGDLWIVPRAGGEARRLTSDLGLEFNPVFSPNGQQIAFSGEYDGNIDVFVLPSTGGEPRRLTFHPGVDTAAGWTPDGKSVLFSSGRSSYSRFNKLFTIPIDGSPLASELPLPMGEQGAISPDGQRIAYVPFWNRRAVPNAYIAWKHYRGGKASPIWIADLHDSRIEKIPRQDSNDHCPMWFQGKVYFLSDRNGPTTLFSYDLMNREVKQELENKGDDLLHASAGPDAIVFEQFGSLSIFDPLSGKAKKVDVRISADFPAVRPHYEKVGKRITSGSLSPNGSRVAFEARGEILTVPAEKGDIRNLTQTTAAAERSPAWSPDGKSIAYFSDESGEYVLHVRDARGVGPIKKIRLGEHPTFYFEPTWSPDSSRIAYSDAANQLFYLDLATGKSTRIDGHQYSATRGFDLSWSPDSRWLAYTKALDNRLRAAFLFDIQSGKSHRLTDGMSDARSTVFDKNGKYLYFTASTDIGPTTNGIDMNGMDHPVTRSVYLIVLNKELPSPLAPESDEEKSPEKPKEEKPAATKIDLENIDQRVLSLPLPPRNYAGIQAGKPGVLFLLERPAILAPPAPGQPLGGMSVQKFDLQSRKAERFLEGVAAFDLSNHGEKVLYRQGDTWSIATLPPVDPARPAARAPAGAAVAASPPGTALKLDDMEVYVDPRAEWKQMFREVWRLEREFLYDPNAHGYDLAQAEKKYAAFLDGIAHRADLNYLFSEMLGNLVLGHTYVGGGDSPEAKQVKGGLLGADFKIDKDRYRLTRIYSGESWNPQLRAPLTQPGVQAKAGEYLLAVNGRELKGTGNLYKALEATAGKAVALKLGPTPDGEGSREVTVVPVESEVSLRNLAWIEDNRRKVEKMTDGRVAYVYLPDTAFGGFNNFNRYFYAQVDKDAVVLDERFNGGGKAADYIIDALRRPLLNYWTTRDGKVYSTPGGAIFGPKVMIINEFAGSGGDAMPWYFRHARVGPLVGTRTWGGLVGIGGYPTLLDGGAVTAPHFAFFSPEGKWDVENHGVAPDVEVELDPYEVRNGRDPQLEKAVNIILEELKKHPPAKPIRPAYPNYHPNGK